MPGTALDPTFDLVSAKLRAARPRRALVPRPRLVDATAGGPFSLIVADAGYGKSSFLAEWAHPFARVIWYALDERDRDPTTFGQHLLAAAGVAQADARAWRARGDGAADELAARVLKQVASMATTNVALVLDDYHAVADVPGINATLTRLVHDAPGNLRIAIAARAPLPLPMARLRAHGAVADIGGAELCFTRAEVAAVLRETLLSAPELDALHALTGGWPAAVQLLGDAWAGQLSRPPGGQTTDHQRIFDDFVDEEIVPRLNAADLEVLSRLSVLEEIDADGCHALFDDVSVFDRLRALAERFSFVTEVVDATGPTYRLHRLMRDVLVRRLSRGEYRAALERAAGPVGAQPRDRRTLPSVRFGLAPALETAGASRLPVPPPEENNGE